MAWQDDAELAGTLHRNHKAYTSMLIARCVEPGTRGGDRKKQSENSDSSKVDAKTFASRSNITDKTVTAYLRTWDAMAQANIVPSRDEMQPGADVPLPDVKTWQKYYRKANSKEPRVEAKPINPGELPEELRPAAMKLANVLSTISGAMVDIPQYVPRDSPKDYKDQVTMQIDGLIEVLNHIKKGIK